MTTRPDPMTEGAEANEMEAAPRRRRWPYLLGVGVLVVAAFAGGAVLAGGGDEVAATDTQALSVQQAVIRDLKEVTTLSGTLGYTAGDPVTTKLDGNVTSMAPVGSVISEGDVMYTIDEAPVVLLYGETPAWRTMALVPDDETLSVRTSGTVTAVPDDGSTIASGNTILEIDDTPVIALAGELPMWRALSTRTEGPDVAQLEQALVDLGYDPDGTVTVDDTFDWYTYEMVLRWQADVGLDEDGNVGLDEIVFIQQPVTIDEMLVSPGDQVNGGAVANVYSTETGTVGPDVKQLETALLRLGYDGGGSLAYADQEFTEGTEEAVLQWQAAIGAETDGSVDLGEILFASEPIRVAGQSVEVGQRVSNGTAILAGTSSASLVSVDLPASEQGLLSEGMAVSVVLPDNSEVPATVTYVADTATGRGGDATFSVEVTLDDPTVGENLDEAPVDVDVITEERDGVLAVPVTALLALAEGGYAVEVDDGNGATHLVGVTPGLYADGFVEIVSSTGLSAGDQVVAP